jgi:hypothetical protein
MTTRNDPDRCDFWASNFSFGHLTCNPSPTQITRISFPPTISGLDMPHRLEKAAWRAYARKLGSNIPGDKELGLHVNGEELHSVIWLVLNYSLFF